MVLQERQPQSEQMQQREAPVRRTLEQRPVVVQAERGKAYEAKKAAVESITDQLRESYSSKLPDVRAGLTQEEKIQLAELFNEKADLAEAYQDSSSGVLEAAQKKQEIYYQIMSIVDGASRRLQAEQAPRGGEMYQPASSEQEDTQAVEKDADTAFTSDMGAVEAQRAEQPAQVMEQVAEESINETQESNETEWDIGGWVKWANKAKYYDPNLDSPNVWLTDIPQEQIRQASGLDQQQFFALTNMMIQRKRGSGAERRAA